MFGGERVFMNIPEDHWTRESSVEYQRRQESGDFG